MPEDSAEVPLAVSEPQKTDQEEIPALVRRLSRPHPSGGIVIERAAIRAAGADFGAVLRWIDEHDGVPEEQISSGGRGLHGARQDARDRARPPARFVLPPGALA